MAAAPPLAAEHRELAETPRSVALRPGFTALFNFYTWILPSRPAQRFEPCQLGVTVLGKGGLAGARGLSKGPSARPVLKN